MTPVEAVYLLYERIQEVGIDASFLALPIGDYAF